MKAILLCAGDATRLAPITSYIPKSLLPIAGIPIVSIIVQKLLKTGIFKRDEIVVICLDRYLKHFMHELRDLQGIQIVAAGKNKGTATHFYHADRLALSHQYGLKNESVLVHYGDIFTTLDYAAYIKEYEKRKEWISAMLAVTKDVRHDYSEVRLRHTNPSDELLVESFIEKPKLQSPTWSGIAIFNRRAILNFIEASIGSKTNLDRSTYLEFAVNIFPGFFSLDRDRIGAYEFAGEWHDIGNLRSYQKLQERFITEELVI